MTKYLAFAAVLLAPVFAQANEISDYVQGEVSGVYTVYMPGLISQQAPMRLDYAAGDRLVMEQNGTQRVMPIHDVDTKADTVNLLDTSGNLVTLSVRFGQGSMTMANGSKLRLSFVRKLTDIDYAAIGNVPASAPAPAKAIQAPEPAEPVREQKPAAAEAAPPTPSGPIKASFDCAKASTAVEGMICGNAQLAELDVRVAAAYKSLRNIAPDKAAVKDEQITWIKQRNACRLTDCLISTYGERAATMESALARSTRQ